MSMKLEVGVAPTGAPNSLRERIAESALRAGRDPRSIALVGITKQHSRETILEALAAGLGDIGENYLQEAREKYIALPPVRKHFVGHVQTNKARAIVELFDVVQSIDRLDAAPADAPELARRLREDEDLEVDGVMAIGPLTEDRAEIARAFECAARTFEKVGGSTLSLGMSADWPEAVAHGSTMLRIGTALFGARA